MNNNLDNGNSYLINRNNKILLVVFCITCLILMVMVGYFLFFNKSNETEKGKNSTVSKPTSNNSYINNTVIDSKNSLFKETGLSIIMGVKSVLIIENKYTEGDYYFTNEIIKSGGKYSPLGGEISYIQSVEECNGGEVINSIICKVNEKVKLECGSNSKSFVRIIENNGNYESSICLTAGAGNKYIDVISGTEKNLYSSDFSMIK